MPCKPRSPRPRNPRHKVLNGHSPDGADPSPILAPIGSLGKLDPSQLAKDRPRISETAVNAALAMIEAAAPKDEIEGALAVQMACTHTAAMAVLARLGDGHGSELRVAALGSAAARLLRAYATQVEVLRRLRHGGQQYVRVEHVYVNDGGQAVIGNVKQPEMRG